MNGADDTIRVLHVDDDPAASDTVGAFLEREDDRITVRSATDAEEGQEILADHDVDCVVSDYDMPGQDGIEFLEAVRETDPRLPFILYTGKGSEEIASEAISAGVTDYLQKERSTDQYALLANRIKNAVGRVRDQHERRLMQRALDQSGEGVFLSDPETASIEYVNDQACEQLGYDRADLLAMTVLDIQPKLPDMAAWQTHVDRIRAEGPSLYEGVHVRSDGTRFPVEVKTGLIDIDGREYLLGLARDITQRKDRERQLDEKTQRLQAIFEASPDAIVVSDTDGTVDLWNPAAERIFGWSAEEVRGERIPIVPPDHEAEFDRHRQCMADEEPIAGVETTRRTKEGDMIDVSLSAAPVRDTEGETVGTVAIFEDITDRKRRQDELEETADRMRMALQGTNSWLWEWHLEDDTITQSAIAGIAGVDEERSTRTLEDFLAELHPDDRESFIEHKENAVAGPGDYHNEFRLTGDGTTRWIESRGQVYCEDGTPDRIVGIATDVTERKDRKRELQRYQRIVEYLNDVATVIGSDGTITYVSPSVRRVLGYEPEELIGENGFKYQPPETSDAVANAIERVIDNPEETETVQTRFRRADGSWCWIESTLRNRLDDEMIEGILVSSRDITERVHRRQELQRYEALIETLPIGYVRTSFDDRFLDMNSTFVDMLDGDSVEEIRSHSVSEFYQDPTTRDRLMEALRDDGEVAGEELKVTTTSGETIWVTVTGRVVAAEEGPYIDALVQDITERKRHADQLRALNERSQRLMGADTSERIADIGVDAAQTVLGLDASAIHLYDAERSGLAPVAAADTVYDLIGDPPVLTEGESIAWRVYEEGEALALDDVRNDPDIYNPETPMRSEIYLPLGTHGILLNGSPTPNAFDEQDVALGEILAASITSALDQVTRTERLRARETELARQNDRLEEFATIVSHDLRNPLNVATTRLELARMAGENEHLEKLGGALDRMEALIDDLLELAREGRTVTDPEAVDLATVVQSCWANVETADATLAVEVEQTVYAERSRLKQVFENLIRNAVEHGGDDVTVTVGEVGDGFYVADDGPGVPEDDRSDVFDTGYSTSDEGTGYGLTIVKQIADAHGWDARVTESEAGGARFEITGVDTTAG